MGRRQQKTPEVALPLDEMPEDPPAPPIPEDVDIDVDECWGVVKSGLSDGSVETARCVQTAKWLLSASGKRVQLSDAATQRATVPELLDQVQALSGRRELNALLRPKERAKVVVPPLMR